jgi:hypothetical protein
MTERRRRASYLSPPDFKRLDWACERIRDAFGTPPYLVGSVTERPDYRDIDLRLILDDDVVERMFGADGRYGTPEKPTPCALRQLLNIALSDFIQRMASPPAPIDFQIQSMSEANVPEHKGTRNPLGVRELRQP